MKANKCGIRNGKWPGQERRIAENIRMYIQSRTATKLVLWLTNGAIPQESSGSEIEVGVAAQLGFLRSLRN